MSSQARTAATRGLLLFVLWLVLIGSMKPGDLVMGVLAAIAATYVSVRLLPSETGHVRLAVLLTLAPRFLWQSLVAGIDVARRALDPRLPLRTGFVDYETAFPRGQARNWFATITSLMPGTVPAGDGPNTIEFHCLDTEQPVAADMAGEEARLAKALVAGQRHA
jgi:multicomponent Na+:H+ antiporter subunit E